jgi:hypothetical protein
MCVRAYVARGNEKAVTSAVRTERTCLPMIPMQAMEGMVVPEEMGCVIVRGQSARAYAD